MEMKYPILFSTLMISLAASAQVNPSARSLKSTSQPVSATESDLPAAPDPKEAPIQEDLIRGSRAVSFIPIGTAYNIFTILTEGQNQVSWSEELESVIFIHRHNNGTVGGSGGLAFDRSTDGGESWTTNTSLSPVYNTGSISTNLGNRYPSAVLYNPTGNTDEDAAFVAAAGPALDAASADASWGLVFRNSARADGALTSETYTKEPGDSEYFPYGLTETPDGSIWYISGVRNGTGLASADSLNGAKFKIWKGTYNAGTNAFDWVKVATLRPAYYTYTDGGFLNRYNTFTYNLAFSPDGNTGYAVIIGGPEQTVTHPISSPRPLIFKSTDGGNSWNPLPDFDFTSLPAMGDFLLGSRQGDGPIVPYFTSLDAVVDETNTLHLVSEVNSRFTDSSDPDSLYFIYLANVQPVSCIYHLSTSNGSDWTAAVLDTVRMVDGTLPNPGSTDISVGPGAQISRSADGSKVFFTWSASDPNLIESNDLPDLFGRGYDVASGEYTFTSNFTKLTSFDGTAFFPTLAPVIIETGTEADYQLPVVFAVPGTDAASAPQFVYVHGIGFNDEDFGLLAPPPLSAFTYNYIGFGGFVSFTNASTNAESYIWDFGDGTALSSLVNPSHTFSASGVYNVCLTATNAGGSNTECQEVELLNVGVEQLNLDQMLTVGPNPTRGTLLVRLPNQQDVLLQVFDVLGRPVLPAQTLNGQAELALHDLSAGIYQVVVSHQDQRAVRRITLLP